ncbi:hypothetical protein [Chitinophaga defluvii]|uniref:Uncharacterized protein n=1 Tax=Chitinophaga defluvii TaxID=3163343 RepID=A0ABV2T8Q3_9BACT
MLDAGAWKGFLIVAGIGCGVYYGYLLFTGRFGHQRRQAGIAGTRDSRTKRTWSVAESQEMEDEPPDHGDNESNDVPDTPDAEEVNQLNALEQLADDLQTIISEHQSGDKEGLMYRLQQEISRYPVLNKPAFRAAISNLIIRAAKEDCSLVVSQTEADALWSHF